MNTQLINYEEKLASMAKKATEVERPSTSTIGTRAGVLTYNKNQIPGNKLDCIIIASTHANMYYEGNFDPDNLANPVCYAYSEDGENMAPHPKAQSPQAESCDTCPKNKWNSAATGRGKACKNIRQLAIIPADTKAEDVTTAEVALLKLPVTSVTNWSNYVNKLATLFSRPPVGMITTIGTQPDAKSQFKITFQQGPLIANEMLGALIERAANVMPTLQREYEPNSELEVVAEVAGAKKKKF